MKVGSLGGGGGRAHQPRMRDLIVLALYPRTLLADGATIVKPAQKVFLGGFSGYFKDLDGHLIEVASNPFWKLDENDNLNLLV